MNQCTIAGPDQFGNSGAGQLTASGMEDHATSDPGQPSSASTKQRTNDPGQPTSASTEQRTNDPEYRSTGVPEQRTNGDSGQLGTGGADHDAMRASDPGATNESLTYDITFRADAAFVEKLRRLQALFSTGDPNPPLAPIFDRAIELALDRHDPERREARRKARRARKERRTAERNSERNLERHLERDSECHLERNLERQPAHAESPQAASPAELSNGREAGNVAASETDNSKAAQGECGGGRRRKVPQWVRDFVFLRDGKQCSYVGPEGRCPETHGLEIDHRNPRGKGGSDDLDNLRAYCRAHNMRAAEIAYGIDFMRERARGHSSSRQSAAKFRSGSDLEKAAAHRANRRLDNLDVAGARSS
jgi:5-methylcytosine-specific restriction endonuclease McrA